MLGVINKSIENFVQATYGKQVWQDVARSVLGSVQFFEPMLMYEDEKTYALLDQLGRVTGKPKHDILDDLGTFLVTLPHGAAMRRLMRFGGATFEDFLLSLDDLNDRVDLALPDLGLPKISVLPQTLDRIWVQVETKWNGFAYVLIGLLRALADDYGTLVFLDIRRDVSTDFCIEVILIEKEFSAGSEFNLADLA